jgi:multidrug efflux pump subunit AcrB
MISIALSMFVAAILIALIAYILKKQQEEIWQLREDFVSLAEEFEQTKCHCQKGVPNGTQK